MRSAGQPPADRIVRVFLICPLSPRRRRNDRFSPTAPASGCPFAEASSVFAISDRASLAVPQIQRSVLLEEQKGRRPQARAPVALSAFLEFPPATRFRESPATAGSAAIIRLSQELSRFAAPTLRQVADCSQHKKRPRLCRNCGRCDFPVEAGGNLRLNSQPAALCSPNFNHLRTLILEEIAARSSAPTTVLV